MRIAFARFMLEGNAFSSVPTTLADFRRTHFLEGQELLRVCQSDKIEVEGFLKNLELSGFIKAVNKHKDKSIEPIPLFSAWSISGGPMLNEEFTEICEKLKKQLQEAGEIDGLYLALHGALVVKGDQEPETTLIKAAREIIGKDIPISASFDLHGNMTREKVENLDILCAYRTNPHYDFVKTGFRAGDLLIRKIAGEIKPTRAWRSLPMILGGGITLSFAPPMNAIFRKMKEYESDPRVLDCSMFMVHPYLDNPDLGWSVHIYTDNNQELAEAIADDLADRCWEMRKKQPPEFKGPEEIVDKIRKSGLARKTGTITVCDASDVVGAGGTGENTALISYLLENAKDLISYTSIRDAVVVEELWDKEIGTEVETSIGGKLQPEINPAVKIKGKLVNKKETDNFGKTLVIDLGHIKLVITEGMNLPMKPSFYEDLGLKIMDADITVVKNFFHFRLYYLLKSRKAYYVKTRGITDFDNFKSIRTNQPVYPLEDVKDWHEVDAIRRGLKEESINREKKDLKKILKPRNKNGKKAAISAAAILGTALLIKKYKSRK